MSATSEISDVDALSAMLRILMRGRPTPMVLADLPTLHERFKHLPPFSRTLPASTRVHDLRLRLAADTDDWLPREHSELQAASLPADASGRHLLHRMLTKEQSIAASAKHLCRNWPEAGTTVTWVPKQAQAYVKRAADAIAGHLLDVAAANSVVDGRADSSSSERAQTALVDAINTVRLQRRTIVHRSWLRTVEVLTDERIETAIQRRGADGARIEIVEPIGCTVVQSRALSSHSVRFVLALPSDLRRGQKHTYSFGMRDHNPGPLINEFLASSGDEQDSPRRLLVRVQFDPHDLPVRVWTVDALGFPTLPDDPEAHEPCELRGSYAEAEFLDTVPHRLYALCWQWSRAETNSTSD